MCIRDRFDTAPHALTAASATAPVGRAASRKPAALSLVAAAFRHDAAQYVKLVRDLPGVLKTLVGLVRSSGGGHAPAGTDKANRPAKNGMVLGPRTPLNLSLIHI